MADRKQISFTLSAGAVEICDNLQEALGISRSAVLELAVREFAERRKPPEPIAAPSPSAAASGG